MTMDDALVLICDDELWSATCATSNGWVCIKKCDGQSKTAAPFAIGGGQATSAP